MSNMQFRLTYSHYHENSYKFNIITPAVLLIQGNDPSDENVLITPIHSYRQLTPIGLEIYNKLLLFPGIELCQFGYSFFIIHIGFAHDEEHIIQFIEDALNDDYSLYSINRLVTRKLQYSTLSYINNHKVVMHQRYLLTPFNKSVDLYNTLFLHSTTYKNLTRKGRKFCKIFKERLLSSQYGNKITRLVATVYDIRIYFTNGFEVYPEYDSMRENLAIMCNI